MKRPSFLEGAGFALTIAVAGGITFVLLVPLLAGSLVLKGVVAVASLTYLLYLLARGPGRAGRVTAITAWVLMTVVAWWFAPSLLLYLLAHAGFIWLLRSLLFHSGVLAALADLGLTVLGLAVAGWALTRTGSVGAALWCFFLVTALFVAIPARFPRRAVSDDDGSSDRFRQAHRSAEAALREITAHQ